MNQLMLLAAACQKSICLTGVPHGQATAGTIHHILTIVLSVLAALAILFVVIGGIRYTVSSGDPQATAKAKNTIIMALVGLIIVIAAQALVTFVITKL